LFSTSPFAPEEEGSVHLAGEADAGNHIGRDAAFQEGRGRPADTPATSRRDPAWSSPFVVIGTRRDPRSTTRARRARNPDLRLRVFRVFRDCLSPLLYF